MSRARQQRSLPGEVVRNHFFRGTKRLRPNNEAHGVKGGLVTDFVFAEYNGCILTGGREVKRGIPDKMNQSLPVTFNYHRGNFGGLGVLHVSTPRQSASQ